MSHPVHPSPVPGAPGAPGHAPLDLTALRSLQRSAVHLAGALEVDEVVTVVLRTGRDVLGCSSCSVFLLDEDAGVLRPRTGRDAGVSPLGAAPEVPLTSSTPSAHVARTRRSLLLRTPEELLSRFDGALNGPLLALGERSWAMHPLTARGRLVGVLRFGFDRPGSLDAAGQTFAEALAGQCAVALERAQLLDTAREALAAAARSEQRYRTLAEAGSLDVFTVGRDGDLQTDLPGWRAITGREGEVTARAWEQDVHPDDLPGVLSGWQRCLDTDTRFSARYRVGRPGRWRWISVVVVPVREDGRTVEWVGSSTDVTERVVAARRSGALQQLTAALAHAGSHAQVAEAVVGVAVRGTGAVRAVLDLHPVEGLPVPGTAPTAGEPSPGQAVVALDLPLATARGELGTLVLHFPESVAEDEGERDFLLALARQSATALERAQLLEAQRSTASVLQEALQPGPLPRVPWLAAHRRTATAAGSDVGGDWAELIVLDDDLVAVVLGDVVGRGVRAASVMGEVRTQVRTLALVDPHPGAVLRGLDTCAAVADRDEDLVTLFYGLLRRDGRLLAASAGHLPPLSCTGTGPAYLDVPPGVPVGVPGDPRHDVLDVHLDPGSGLVVFSDGLVETRARSLTDGMAAALDVFRSTARDTPAAIVDELVDVLTRGQQGHDDVTVLALRLLPAATRG